MKSNTQLFFTFLLWSFALSSIAFAFWFFGLMVGLGVVCVWWVIRSMVLSEQEYRRVVSDIKRQQARSLHPYDH